MPFKSPVFYSVIALLLTAACQFYEKREPEDHRVFVKDPKKDPAYLVGRLPGPAWKEHQPARFKAMQSFQTRAEGDRAVLLLYKRKAGKKDAPQRFLKNLLRRLQRSRKITVTWEKELTTAEGVWHRVMLESNADISRMYAIRKADHIYWVQFTASNVEMFALHSPEVERYIGQFWFLYR